MSRRPLILLDALLVREQPTGVGRSILELIQALAAADREFDFKVLVSEPDHFSWLLGRSNWDLVFCRGARGSNLKKSWFTQFSLPRLVGRLGGDLLHSLQFVAPLTLCCPSVVTVHDLTYLRFPQTIEKGRRIYYKLLVPPSLRRAAAVLTNSQATADDVLQRFGELAGRVHPTPFGTPSWVWRCLDLERAGKISVVNAHPEMDGGPYFLFVGTLEPRKNLEGLLAAYNLFLRDAAAAGRPVAQVPDLVLIGGRGWGDRVLRRSMKILIQRKKLRVVDFCAPEQLWTFYRGATALVFPSLHEGFGFPILEGMAAEIPVMTSAWGAMAEVAGHAALLVDPLDPVAIAAGLEQLAWNRNFRKELINKGMIRAQAFSWRRTAAATLAVYRQVLEEDNRPAV